MRTQKEPPTRVLTPPVPTLGPSGTDGTAEPQARPKLKKLRLAVILSGLSGLALVSTVFGMMMAVSSDLPDLENRKEYQRSRNSVVVAEPTRKGEKPPPLAKLTNNQNRILVGASDISPNIKNAVISIEDRRFYEHEGVDYNGIARAFVQDIRQKRAAQGGSTITQQFVKNALAAQADRSVFQKLRESALAYHLERKWTKQKVLTQYLNSVYFGNGAYGVEAAVRTYFGGDDDPSASSPSGPTGLTPAGGTGPGADGSEDDVGRPTAGVVSPAEAALLAGMIASPSMYDPVQNPVRAKERRDIVLDRMVEQKMISPQEHREALAQALPSDDEIDPPQPDSKQPYFTSWLTQQLVDRYKAPAVFTGGLRVKTTLDPELQGAAEQAITRRLSGVGPSASLVAIENRTGEVKAMVGGTDFGQRPFNLATNGHRQPGSSFKPFTLIRALQDGVSPEATFTSQKKVLPVANSGGREKFVVNNYEDSYAGVASLRSATARSDNSVYAELGLKVGPRRIAALAQEMGLATRVSTNPAMTLGGLTEGLTPLELAYAYSTIANKGVRVSGTLDTTQKGSGPVAIERVEGGGRDDRNKPVRERVFPAGVGETAQQLLAGVIQGGTGEAAQIGEFAAGKTGTTENYGDAWFVGFNKELTVAVWVGYPEKLTFMKTEYGGSPVAGGTYPTEIWHDFMRSWISVRERRQEENGENDEEESGQEETVPTGPSAPAGPGGEADAPPEGGEGSETPERPEPEPDEPRQPAAPREPAPVAPPAPQQPPASGTPPGGGGSTGGAGPG